MTAAADGIAGPGQPLEPGIRDTLSTSFGHDFSPVRVHVGPAAAHAATSLGAKAYAVGNDVAFAHGAYDPLSQSGRALIAHELAHVVQHRGLPRAANYSRAGEASKPLERQADAAAARWQHGLPRGWTWQRATEPFVGRADSNWTAPPSPYKVPYADGERTITEEQWSADNHVVRINMGDFVVPQEKGPWGARYDAIARGGGLQAVTDVSSSRIRAALWEQRAPTPELRRLWLLRVQWPSAQAGTWWEEAGGNPNPPGQFEPKAGGSPAQIDHIVELQLGGSNVPENLAPHTAADNEASGRNIWRTMRATAQAAATTLSARHPRIPLRQLILSFSSASQQPGYPDVSALPALPAAADQRAAAIAARKGVATKALRVHNTALADLAAGTRPSAADRAAVATAHDALPNYPIVAGPNPATLKVSATPAGTDLIENSDVPQNHAARELIPGLTLEKLTRQGGRRPQHVITAWLNSPKHPVREGTRLPLTIANEAQQQIPLLVNDPNGTGRLSVVGASKAVQFTYPYLSTGTLALRMTEQGLAGQGTLTPSVPLLRRVPITVEVDNTGLRGSVTADPNKLSFPPFRVTEAAVTVNLGPQLSVGGRVAFALGQIVTGEATAGLDAQGFFARGTVRGHIPGLDEATGQVDYRPATGPTGFVVARASRPSGLVRGGEVRVDFANNAWTVSGQLDLMLPGNSPAKLSVRQRGNDIVYRGEARLNVPGLRPVDVDLSYDGTRVAGSARTTFTLLGATGDLTLRYLDGRFSGEGNVELRRGRFTGKLTARLDQEGRISGSGQGSLEIRPGLVGTVGVTYSPDRRLRVTGEMRFPPYQFMDQHGAVYTIFRRNIEIPIFAIPLGIGSVGLVATIGGSLVARYSYGPGVIRDMVISAGFEPLEENPNVELSAGAKLVIPAQAGLELGIRAGIGASVAIASATGGITVTGGLLLRGGLEADAQLRYARNVLTFDASAQIKVQPVLTLRIEADILIEALVGGPWRFPYELASYSYPLDAEFGMIVPFHYQSDQPLRLPSVSDIRWITPNIDVQALARQIAGQVRTGLGF